MPKRIPITAAKSVADKYKLKQVCLVAWDGDTAHVVTYGKSVEDCDQAAQCGNLVKKTLGFPDTLCKVDTARVKRLKEEIKSLKEQLQGWEDTSHPG
jgi:hypothetical protein